ncbi:hypothetical protein [Anditalea andensis]|uniref:Tryptophan-rich sensory protein n=1 Tax=Anditalea andensis TaxID=1048983 RepID=A0A074L5S7_9BACT|nr:hypothetical protein [Anditalea andensis]KEO75168.1 hypothetical protein EL17_05730 [Anditalea andensis]
MNHIRSAISQITWQLRLNALIKAMLLAVTICLLLLLFGSAFWIIAGVAAVGFIGSSVLFGAFTNRQTQAVQILHKSSSDLEFSLGLLNKSRLSVAEQLQLERISQSPPIATPLILHHKIYPYVIGLCITISVYLIVTFLPNANHTTPPQRTVEGKITAETATEGRVPQFVGAEIDIQPPSYTGIKATQSNDMNISAMIGSRLTWTVTFEHTDNLRVSLVHSNGQEINFQSDDIYFTLTDKLVSSGIYAIKAFLGDEEIYRSPFYKLEALLDSPPVIEPQQEDLYTYHFLKDNKKIQLEAMVSDDFLVTEAYIVATVARGSGENVKFRETKLPFDQKNFKSKTLRKEIDLNRIEMKPGDELYYYWAARDNRQPDSNFSRSETYFIKYQDTTKLSEGELTAMAIQVMPEYFRSQRQIIIDTERLIKEKAKQTPKTFNETSNEIGFDQKLLRMRYGQYLGEEFESSAGGSNMSTEEGGDLLESFMHLHDHEGEHEPGGHDHHHEHDHEHDHKSTTPNEDDGLSALLEQYLHNHDDAEANTFYEASTRSLLKMALEQMWKSELHLRLFEPEKALPFQNKALEYLKTVQQKSRAYVRKTGFDPPPIREAEKRLTGEFKDMATQEMRNVSYSSAQFQQLVAKVLGITEKGKASPSEQETVNQLGSIWTERIKYSGLQDWATLLDLQKLATGEAISSETQTKLKTKLLPLIQTQQKLGSTYAAHQELETNFWKKIR